MTRLSILKINMKILFFNIWAGSRGELLFDYIKEQAKDTDIFCFQEVLHSEVLDAKLTDGGRPRLFSELSKILSGFEGFFNPSSKGRSIRDVVDYEMYFGQATFVKKPLKILSKGSEYIFGSKDTAIVKAENNEPQIMQYAKIGSEKGEFWVINVHGLWYPGAKLDSESRIKQSEIILKFLETCKGPKILGGDLNLLPDTKSVLLLEAKMNNLIKDFNIENTRNKISWDMYPSNDPQHFSDYVFTSSDIKVKKFEVPYNEVSDHLPMILEFEI